MARKLRVEYPGALYHVMSRGDHGDPLFEDDRDRERFVETLGEAALKTGWQVHAYCLMSNHFHLVVETPQGNLAAGMKWLLGTYTGRFNRRHKLFGHLFSGRYKSLVVDGRGTGYLKTVCDYVHLNPVRAKLIGPEAEAGGVSLEQLPCVFVAGAAAAAVVASGPVAGGVPGAQRQRSGAAVFRRGAGSAKAG